MERWKPVIGYEKTYRVSNKGRVKSVDRIVVNKLGRKYKFKGKLLKPYEDIYGYLVVGLRDRGRNKTAKIHRLVASAFIPNVDNQTVINHIDFDRKNNNVENLEWVSPEDNTKYSHRHGRYPIGEENNKTKLKEHEVIEIRSLYKEGMSPTKIAKKFNVSRSTVHRIVSFKSWAHLKQEVM